MDEEQSVSLPSVTAGPPVPPTSLRTHAVSLLFFVFLLTPLFWFGSGCTSCNCSAFEASGGERVRPVMVRAVTAGEAFLFLDVKTSGIYTPTGNGFIIPDGATEPAAVDLNLLADQGYVAVRVPHAPPSYTVSSLIAGTQDGEPGAFFRYFSPPTSTVETRVPVTLTRRAEFEDALNARFPITDGRSHWEVWWLPDGAPLPMPNGPFLLADEFPAPFSFEFRADFGDAAVDSCSGCPFQYVAFDGASLLGPFDGTVAYGNDLGRPLAIFGTHCTHFPPDAPMVSTALLTPSTPYSFTFCLENYDAIGHTFVVDATSEQGWAYTYYTQTVAPFGQPAPPPVQVGAGPFQVQVAGAEEFDPGMLLIYAMTSPTFTVDAGVRELYQIQAQSVFSPTVRAEALAAGFSTQFDPQQAERKTYLPTITKQ